MVVEQLGQISWVVLKDLINGATWNSSGYFDFDGSNDYEHIPYHPWVLIHSLWIYG